MSSTLEFNRVTLEFNDRVAIISLNHREVLNAMGPDMLEGLTSAIAAVQDSDCRARCVLLTGNGNGFCAGANLSGSGGKRPRKSDSTGLRTGYHPMLLSLRDLPMPIVTAVNGAAAGVGMSIALMGDIVCAARSAFFLQAFAHVGLVPDGGASFLLPRLIGWGRAMELSMLAERLSAEKALEWGLVNRVFDSSPSVMQGSMDIAKRLANGPASLVLMRKLYWSTWHNSFEQQLDMEAQLQSQASKTEDHVEGLASFLEKREPHFKGR